VEERFSGRGLVLVEGVYAAREMSVLPAGTVTFLFADVEGSTRLVRELGDSYGSLLGEIRELLRQAVVDGGGAEVDCRADELFAVFPRAGDAVGAAVAAQRAIADYGWSEGVTPRVRIGLHTGEPTVEGDFYLGLDVNRAARICTAGHGGQVLTSQATRLLISDTIELRDLGSYSFAGLTRPEQLYQVLAPGLQATFPAIRTDSAQQARRLSRRRRPQSRKVSLEEAAWRARRLLPELPPALRQPLAELGAELFIAHRAARGADGFLKRIDRDKLARRLAAHRKSEFGSQRSHDEAIALEAQVACIDQLRQQQDELGELAGDVALKLDAALTAQEIASLHTLVTTQTAALDHAFTKAATTLTAASLKLTRTRHRGIYRSDAAHYVVLYYDESGCEREREFDTPTAARSFLAAQRASNRVRQDPDELVDDPMDFVSGGGFKRERPPRRKSH
jgi:class 3 adenylate cyclase